MRNVKIKKPRETTTNKNRFFIQLKFKGDDITGSVNMRLKTSLTRTYPAATSQVEYFTHKQYYKFLVKYSSSIN